MTEDRIREIVRDELSKVFGSAIDKSLRWERMKEDARRGRLPTDEEMSLLNIEAKAFLIRLRANWEWEARSHGGLECDGSGVLVNESKQG